MAAKPKFDSVNRPKHYADSKIETIDYIEDKELTFNCGNAVKYISRAGKKTKDKIEDLRKAAWYIAREIRRLTFGNASTLKSAPTSTSVVKKPTRK